MQATPLPDSDWRDMVKWLLRQRRRYRVTEMSMSPTLQPGDEVLVDLRAYRTVLPEPGDIVVAYHPARDEFKLIKRVEDVTPDGCLFLQGDNLVDSTDSRHFGVVAADKILGRVTSKFA